MVSRVKNKDFFSAKLRSIFDQTFSKSLMRRPGFEPGL